MDEITIFIAGATVLIAIGLYCVAAKRNAVKVVIGIEIMTSGVNLYIITVGTLNRGGVLRADAAFQSLAVLSMTIGACIAALALALVVGIHRHYATLDLRKLNRLRW